jgi:hypothetical protein
VQGKPARCSQPSTALPERRPCDPSDTSNKGALTMSTLLFTIQVLCYAVGIVSATLNIAGFVRRWRAAEAPFEGDGPGDWP